MGFSGNRLIIGNKTAYMCEKFLGLYPRIPQNFPDDAYPRFRFLGANGYAESKIKG
jgi:hypothetical protein